VSSWIVKGNPARNDLRDMLVAGDELKWVTRKPPRAWAAGDRVFFWSSSPDRFVIGLGRLLRVDEIDDEGDTHFDLRYLTAPLASPIGIAELRADAVVGGASFLKAGAAGTVFPVSEAEAARLMDLLVARNPELEGFSWDAPAPRSPAPKRTKAAPARVAPPAKAATVAKSASSAKSAAAAAGPRAASDAARAAPPDGARETRGGAAPTVALSVRQPWAELILRGKKTIEVRTLPLNKRERVHIYASLGATDPDACAAVERAHRIDIERLPRGVLVGTVEIVGCRPLVRGDSAAAGFEIEETDGRYAWLLARPERAEVIVKPARHPQPVFFRPFDSYTTRCASAACRRGQRTLPMPMRHPNAWSTRARW
jgi:predicted transcriptional regulator